MTAKVSSDFLAGPGPQATAKRINFAETVLACYKDYYAIILDDILSAEECAQFLRYAEATTNAKWERALVNTGGGRQQMIEDVRKCGRIIWDDQAVVDRLWARCAPFVPELAALDAQTWPRLVGKRAQAVEGYPMTRVNERMRLLKYTGGEYFKPHCDGPYITPDGSEKTFFTLHLYLNDAERQEDGQILRGGATTFWDHTLSQDRRLDVHPKIGSVLIFQHEDLLHSGDDVLSGVKYTMRSDLLYRIAG